MGTQRGTPHDVAASGIAYPGSSAEGLAPFGSCMTDTLVLLVWQCVFDSTHAYAVHLQVIATVPTVPYRIIMPDGTVHDIRSPAELPEPVRVCVGVR